MARQERQAELSSTSAIDSNNATSDGTTDAGTTPGRTGGVERLAPTGESRKSRAWPVYLASVVLSAMTVTFIMRLWRADWKAPFFFRGDAVASAAHFRTTMDAGWYEFTDKLGAPYGQHYHDFPFSDELHPAAAKLLGIFTDQAGLAFNAYYVLGYLLVALSATWFLRKCGLSPVMTVALAVLYSVAPYHFIRGEAHLFLASYYCVPLALGVIVSAAAGRPLWGPRAGGGKFWGMVTGPGAVTVIILILVTLSAAYYAVFTGLLLAAAGLFSFVRNRNFRRLVGVVATGTVLVGVLLAAMLPDALYSRANGSNSDAFVRAPAEAEIYALKFSSLILPAIGHRIPAWAELNTFYTTNYPLPSEQPAIGFVAAVGFLILMLAIPLHALASRRNPSDATLQLRDLSFLCYTAFLFATVGGISTLISLFLTDSIRGWNRMSIFIALLSLTALGLVIEHGVRRLQGSVGWLGRLHTWIVTGVAAGLVFVIGVADQSLTIAVPDYRATSEEWNNDEAFVRALSDQVPSGAMIFQLPYMAFPESGAYNGVFDSEQLKLYIHNSDIRWSGGGIKGRPQSDWPATVAGQDAPTMTRNLAMIGFEGILVDRNALADGGVALEQQLIPILGDPALVSPDGRYAYFPLAPVIEQVNATTTEQERDAVAQQITQIAPGGLAEPNG